LHGPHILLFGNDAIGRGAEMSVVQVSHPLPHIMRLPSLQTVRFPIKKQSPARAEIGDSDLHLADNTNANSCTQTALTRDKPPANSAPPRKVLIQRLQGNGAWHQRNCSCLQPLRAGKSTRCIMKRR
jgi:hypothetical protein